MASKSRIYTLNILAETKNLVDGLKKADDATRTAGDRIKSGFKAVGAAALAAGAAAGAFAVKLAVDGVKAAIEDEAAQVRLATALKNTTGATNAQIAAIEQQILKTSLATGIADDQLRPALSRLAIATGDTAKSQELLNLALDISASTGKPLEAVTQALGKAYEGNTTSLSRLGVGLGAADIKALGLEGTISQLSNTFGGAAAKQANTFEGQMARLNVAFDEAKETVGAALLPVLTQMLDFVVQKIFPMVQRFADGFDKQATPAIEKIKDVIVNFVLPAMQNLWVFITDYVYPTLKNLLTPIINVLRDAFEFLAGKVRENQEAFDTAQAIMLNIWAFVRDKLAPILGDVLATAFNIITRAIGLAIDNFGRVFSIIEKVARFLGFDLDLALGQATQKMNKNTEATADAYRQFNELNKQTKEVTLPVVNSISTGFDNLATAQNNVGKATRETTEAIKEQDSWLDRWNKKWGTDPTGANAVAAARGLRSGRAIAGLGAGVNAIGLDNAITGSVLDKFNEMAKRNREEFGQELGLENAALLNVRFSDLIEAGLGGASFDAVGRAIQQLTVEGALTGGLLSRPTGTQSLGELVGGRANQINININGTVVNPEGTARAITNVLQNSNARSGVGVLTPVLGLE